MNNTLVLSDMVPIRSRLFPNILTGYGRLFIIKLPKFMADYLSHSIDDMFKEYKYSTIRCDSIKQIRPEDIHFPKGMKRDILKTKEKESLVTGLTSKITMIDESENLYDWLSKQNEASRALILQPGPKWWEHNLEGFDPYNN